MSDTPEAPDGYTVERLDDEDMDVHREVVLVLQKHDYDVLRTVAMFGALTGAALNELGRMADSEIDEATKQQLIDVFATNLNQIVKS